MLRFRCPNTAVPLLICSKQIFETHLRQIIEVALQKFIVIALIVYGRNILGVCNFRGDGTSCVHGSYILGFYNFKGFEILSILKT